MIEFIKKATKEFETNGRSDLFVSMEDKIISKGNMMQVYFFARYAKGADIDKLQDVLLEKAPIEICYYFFQYVSKNNDFNLLISKAIATGNIFWVYKVEELARAKKVYSKYKPMFSIARCNMEQNIRIAINEDIDRLINRANGEYACNRRTSYFVECENSALYSRANAYGILFATNVKGANIKKFEQVALLKGEPLNIYLLATQCEGVNCEAMLKGLELAKLDYNEVQLSATKLMDAKKVLKYKIRHCEDELERRRLTRQYNQLPDFPPYLLQIDNELIPGVQFKINHQVKAR